MANKTVLMCPPTYFEVAYEINAWMHKEDPVDTALAKQQWQKVHDTYKSLGYAIHLIEGIKDLPDMVFTANGGLVIDGKAALPRFKHAERQGETRLFEDWFKAHGYETFLPERDFEGEGDCLYAADILFAGHGFRSDIKSHSELKDFFGKKVISLRLIDPRFYHLDTAMCPIDDETLMYYPKAFDEEGRAALKKHFRNIIEASEADAAGFGLNAVSDGQSVVLSSAATQLRKDLRAHGFNPIPVDMTEFRKSGGAVKCCTLELRHT